MTLAGASGVNPFHNYVRQLGNLSWKRFEHSTQIFKCPPTWKKKAQQTSCRYLALYLTCYLRSPGTAVDRCLVPLVAAPPARLRPAALATSSCTGGIALVCIWAQRVLPLMIELEISINTVTMIACLYRVRIPYSNSLGRFFRVCSHVAAAARLDSFLAYLTQTTNKCHLDGWYSLGDEDSWNSSRSISPEIEW